MANTTEDWREQRARAAPGSEVLTLCGVAADYPILCIFDGGLPYPV